jgi:hypothetical protein
MYIPSVFIRRPSTARVLKAQNDVDGLALALHIDHFGFAVGLCREQAGLVDEQSGFEALCGAVRDGPTVIARAERPTAFGNVAVVSGSVVGGWRKKVHAFAKKSAEEEPKDRVDEKDTSDEHKHFLPIEGERDRDRDSDRDRDRDR